MNYFNLLKLVIVSDSASWGLYQRLLFFSSSVSKILIHCNKELVTLWSCLNEACILLAVANQLAVCLVWLFWGGGGGLTVKMSLEFVTVQLPPGYPRNRLSASSFVSLQKVQTSHQATRHDGNVKRLYINTVDTTEGWLRKGEFGSLCSNLCSHNIWLFPIHFHPTVSLLFLFFSFVKFLY